ncbi:MAG: bifunctional phosphopantothenoylcysteine decarboxylase/phosphopantothenate--cysteine ligase CoaBC [Labilithrix sp.]|nr:bifunctional phosphopantothenoylcysteine decarboxylase/phosphopantothenate--cysteine ligase CoaBC [Labilithrix sp.]MCW5816850.1 bifunctional phosphopantothenoylcysteine decarboxylase/phosphopantothenate--cysteine ligase CoaBC [Labilithrix sp.]
MKIALAVTGSVAAYKAVEVARLFVKAGHEVIPLMTASATRFVGAVTLSGICGAKVAVDMWDPDYPGELHVAIADRADAIVVVPATADVLARFAEGRADDLVTATVLCARGAVFVAPAMHPRMWAHPATQRNVAALGNLRFIGPVHGLVASGDSGMGRMAEPATIVDAVLGGLGGFGARDLAGRHVVVTAGPTFEAIDPVRFLGNRSSGKMGFAVAARAAARGARVTLIAGPVALATPGAVVRVDVESAEDMRGALAKALPGADALVMAAAVADFRPDAASATKIKKGEGAAPSIALAKNPDLIAEIGAARTGARPVLVAFALETGDDDAVVAYAKDKLTRKRVDVVVANAAHESLGRGENRVSFVDAEGASPFVAAAKDALADRILDRVVAKLSSARQD